jgi:steroid delta-isomerase-like uncharacterized protein
VTRAQTTEPATPPQTLAREFFAGQDRLRGGPPPELCTADYEAHLGGNPPVGLDGHGAFAAAFYAAFPDLSHEVTDVIVEGAAVAVRFVIRGTHTGAFFGIPASGRPVVVVANVLLDVEGGRVRRLRGVFDEAGLLRQIGVLAA